MAELPWTGPLPTLHDVYAARRVIAPHLPRTPLISAPALDRLPYRGYPDRQRAPMPRAPQKGWRVRRGQVRVKAAGENRRGE